MSPVIQELAFGLRVEGTEQTAAVEGTIADGRFVLTDPAAPESPMEGPASAAMLQLALLADLGPRPVPSPAVPFLLADTLASLDREGLLAAWSQESRETTAIADAEVVIWTAWATWSFSTRRRLIRTTTVADAGARGLALVEVGEEGVVVRPATATDVWRSLTTLLPAN